MRLALPLCLAALAVAARADETPPLERTIAIHPAKPPTPALSVRLLPSRAEQVPGDAAVFYHRAIESLIQLRYRELIQAGKSAADEASESPDYLAADWLRLPIDKFPRERVRKALDNRWTVLEEARLGSLRETCDWGFRYRDEGYSLMLSEIQEMRSVARWLAVKARLDADEGRVDEAVQDVRTGLAVARDVGRGDIYIQSLVAIACANLALDELEDLIQKPGAPNLYWALATIPRPLIDLSGPAFGESVLLEREFPMLRKIDGDAWSLETARACGDQFARKLGQDVDGWPPARSPLTRPAVDDLPAHAVQLLTIAKDYRRSKQALRDGGAPTDRVEAMPMIQVVGLDSYRAYQIASDEVVKWSHLPYWLGAKGWREAESRLLKLARGFPFVQLIPATRSAHAANVRLERRFAVLMVVEAVRLYAATHDGALPPRLDDLTDAPAPPDPITGKSFEYKLEGDRAFLSSPAPAGWEQVRESAIRYELRPAR